MEQQRLSKEQVDLLKSLSTNYLTGLPDDYNTSTLHDNQDDEEYNVIPAPMNCPSWACIILPCINHFPSMKLYKEIRPIEAEVRKDSKWVVYDAISIRKGDIVRLNDGDIVPADVVVLSLGMDFVEADFENSSAASSNSAGTSRPTTGFVQELVVDSSNVNGYTKPHTISIHKNGMIRGSLQHQQLYAGSMILQGCCIAVVTKTGSETLLGSLITKGKWPPKEQIAMSLDGDGNYELVAQSEVI